MSAVADIRRAANGEEVEWLGRAGLVAKGISYGIVALLALQVAFGDENAKARDRGVALQAVAGEPYGAFLVGALAAGFAAYALWRLAEAVFDRNGKGDGAKGLASRGGKLARAGLYAFLSVLCVTILLGASGQSNEDRDAARVLALPLGRYIVAAVGLGFLAAAAFNGWRAVTCKFMKEMKRGEMGTNEERVYRLIGRLGHAARAVVFGLIGFFVVKTAWQFDPQEAIGLDGALRKLVVEEHGRVWLGTVAGGLGAYGLFCLVQARYRRV